MAFGRDISGAFSILASGRGRLKSCGAEELGAGFSGSRLEGPLTALEGEMLLDPQSLKRAVMGRPEYRKAGCSGRAELI